MQAKQLSQWNILPQQQEFQIKQDTELISLKEKLPEQAKKVQLYINSHSGYNEEVKTVEWAFSTFCDIKYFQMHPYNQNAWTVSNENVTLRLDDRQVIDVKRNNSFPIGNFSLNVRLVGYKI